DRLGLRQPEGRRAGGADPRAGAEAGLPAGQGHAGAVRGAGFRALLAAADGRSRTRGQYGGGPRLLPDASAVAAQRPDPQIHRRALIMSVFEITKAATFDAAHHFPNEP